MPRPFFAFNLSPTLTCGCNNQALGFVGPRVGNGRRPVEPDAHGRNPWYLHTSCRLRYRQVGPNNHRSLGHALYLRHLWPWPRPAASRDRCATADRKWPSAGHCARGCWAPGPRWRNPGWPRVRRNQGARTPGAAGRAATSRIGPNAATGGRANANVRSGTSSGPGYGAKSGCGQTLGGSTFPGCGDTSRETTRHRACGSTRDWPGYQRRDPCQPAVPNAGKTRRACGTPDTCATPAGCRAGTSASISGGAAPCARGGVSPSARGLHARSAVFAGPSFGRRPGLSGRARRRRSARPGAADLPRQRGGRAVRLPGGIAGWCAVPDGSPRLDQKRPRPVPSGRAEWPRGCRHPKLDGRNRGIAGRARRGPAPEAGGSRPAGSCRAAAGTACTTGPGPGPCAGCAGPRAKDRRRAQATATARRLCGRSTRPTLLHPCDGGWHANLPQSLR